VPSAPHPPASAPAWRREPYRILFPAGAILAVLAVLPFTLGGAGGGFLGLFHSVAQIQGFLTCFIAGFLFTFVPRRTHTAGPEGWELAAAVGLPAGAVASAWGDGGALPYVLWLALVGIVLAFTVRRLRAEPARGHVPAVFVWVPISLAAGAAGALLAGLAPALAGGGAPSAWAIGRGLLVQGFVAGLVLGVGGFLVPQLTRGEAAPEALDPRRLRRDVTLHAAASIAFFGSFPLEELLDSPRTGMALRALVATGVLLGVARIHRPPTLPGLHRRLVWLGAWLVPLGFWMGALLPDLRGAALHVLFVGGFAQITLAVSTHVVLVHGGRSERLAGSPWPLRAMAGLLAAAFAGRIAAELDGARIASWLAIAGVAFGGAVAAWAVLVGPVLWRVDRPAEGSGGAGSG
jgi:uncharacterized protein involved in response to NO